MSAYHSQPDFADGIIACNIDFHFRNGNLQLSWRLMLTTATFSGSLLGAVRWNGPAKTEGFQRL
jgi:hypothetical protein